LEHIEVRVSVDVPRILVNRIGCLQFWKWCQRSIFSFPLMMALWLHNMHKF